MWCALAGVGIDDYIALTKAVGYEPAITIRFQLGTDADVREARDWVEYMPSLPPLWCAITGVKATNVCA